MPRLQSRRRNPLQFAKVNENGVRFESGVPVTFDFMRNTERSPYIGSTYQQDIEPAGRYLLHRPPSSVRQSPWEFGTTTFNNPLVLAFNTGDAVYDERSWKAQLQRAYGKTGKTLSRALLKEGYDGIVTVELSRAGKPLGTSEIVDLRVVKNSASSGEKWIATRKTAQDTIVHLWPDGSLTWAMGRYIEGSPNARTPEQIRKALAAGWLVLGEVEIYDDDEVPALIKAARWAADRGSSPAEMRKRLHERKPMKPVWTVIETDRDGKPRVRVWKLPRIGWSGLAVWKDGGTYSVWTEIQRSGTYEPTGVEFTNLRDLTKYLDETRAGKKRNPAESETRGETMCAWIKERLAEGRSVYVQTPLRTTEIKPKHADLVRVHKGNCQVRRGKAWDIIDWTRVTARNPRQPNPSTRAATLRQRLEKL